jgi:FecR protein
MRTLGLQLLIWAFGVGVLTAQSTPAPTARLVIRSGLVEVQRGNVWKPIAAGEPVNPGERIRTGSGSRAAVEIEPGKVVTLNELSEIQIQLAPSASSPLVQLESGSMKVVSASNIQVAAKDTKLESTDRPVDLELGYDADKLNLTIFNGSVRNGPMVINGGNQDPNVRTYTAGTRPQFEITDDVPIPTFYVYPYFLYGNRDPNEGKIVPPVVNNPTNPAYRPTQIVPPMSDPIRVPVTGR